MFEFHIRDAVQDDFSEIKRLNDKFVHFTSPMELARIEQLHNLSAYHRVIEQHDKQTSEVSTVGFLLAMKPATDYSSDNYQWFDLRYKHFLYVDRVVIDSTAQGKGLGKKLYDDLFCFALKHRIELICCEYNLIPANPISANFHQSYGFHQVGRLDADDKSKVVSMQIVKLPN
ncbi:MULTISPECIES: GNAT family N-acetyltransferase [Alteromonadaceae]|uniref:GNAT family N-acetyltransferase n=1 Tax=Alteromonadaceae TaxID=72275 RepID=UPI001C0A2D98|nr:MULTISPECIES: GNAT family N-acetyltransferase [Aliiglaciecola]MBU2879502.1 GNAT family N-acetyltransferase [Aliiglaciecola lipolytica]MDO6712577.1 GNAT family N-acetyltransferase [Aliiglaciecola sp. 2_MG-2023]MDO6753679.1 GNAT family N-acetyltransferase [Aliiglaciecola sp. 1_MG-2023]